MRVLITGVTCQDGSNMVRHLLDTTELDIYGSVRHLSNCNHININDIRSHRFKIVTMDITDQQSIINNIKTIKPDYIINFASQSYVSESWNQPLLTFTSNTLPIIYFLETIREYVPKCRFCSVGSSEEFGNGDYIPQDLQHPRNPISPYGASKCAAGHLVKVYRESYNIYAIHSILFNHDGIRQGKEFVTRKITSNIARITHDLRYCARHGTLIKPLELGNINVYRDWSDSEDFVEAIWLMLQQSEPRDYLLSSNSRHSVKEFVDLACHYAGLETEWHIDQNNELKSVLMCQGQIIVKINKNLFRPAEITVSSGDSDESRKILQWEPRTDFKTLVKKMVDHDVLTYDLDTTK
jgi:GDPmannose 4,6-dehydratase